MFYNLFKSYHPVLVILIPIVGVLLWLSTMVNIQTEHFFVYDTCQMPFYRIAEGWLDQYNYISVILSLVLIIFIGFMLVRLSTKYILIQDRTYLPALFYVVLVSGFPELQQFNPALVCVLFLLIVIEKVFDSYKKRNLCYNYFEAALILSIGSLFYYQLIYFMFFIWIAHTIFRPFIWREWLFTFIGAVIPYFFLFSYYYLFNDQQLYLIDYLHTNFTCSADITRYVQLPHIILYGFLTLFLVISTYNMAARFRLQKVQIRNYLLAFVWLLVISCMIILLDPAAGSEMIYIIAMPASVIMAHYFHGLKTRWWGEIVFFVLFLLLLFVQFYDRFF